MANRFKIYDIDPLRHDINCS